MHARLQHTKKRIGVRVAVPVAILLLTTVSGLASVEKDFFQNADLSNGNNYNPSGLPGGGSDVLLTTTSTALTVNGGSLNMSSLNQLNNLAYVISSGSMTLAPLNGNVVGANGNDAIYLGGSNSSLTLQGVSLQNMAGSNFDVAQANSTLSISGSITLMASNSMTKTGAGTLNLSGQYFAFGGGMVINGGTTNFLAGFSNFSPTRTALVVNNLNTGPGSAVTLNIQTSVQFRALHGVVVVPFSGPNTATINLLGSSTELKLETSAGLGGGTYGGTLAGSGRVSFTSGTSTETLTFSGNNTYTGTTTVNGATLRIDGMTSGQGNYVVATTSPSTARLTGSGRIGLAANGTVTVGGVAPTRLSAGGDSAAGTLNIVTSGTGGVIFGQQSAFLVDIGPSGASDLLAIAGGYVDLTSSTDTLTLNSLAGAFDGYDYTIATFSQNVNEGTFQTVSGLATGYAVQYNPTNIKLLAPQLPLQMTAAVSRKMHGPSVPFDVNLLTTEPVECRSSGGSHTLVFTFSNAVVSGSASVTAGKGQVSGAPTFSGKTMTVNLAGVSDVQRLGITLQNVMDRFSQVTPDTTFTINMLVGDVNADRVVNAGDALLTRNRSGSAANSMTFRSDTNLDGVVNSGDTVIIRERSGNGLP